MSLSKKPQAAGGTDGGKWRAPLFWAISVIALDLTTKASVQAYFSPCEPIFSPCGPVPVTGFFNLIFTYNTGAAFSIFSGDGGMGQGLKMALIAFVSLLPFTYFYVKAAANDRILLSSLGLIWGGALGNIHDRLRWGKVVDFLDFHVAGYHWPAFNVADIAICAGAGLLALSIWREKPKTPAALAKK
jgi:signal peptidase II